MVRRHGRRPGRSAARPRTTQPHGLGRLGSRLRDRRRAGMERSRAMVGHLARAGVAGGSPARRRRRARHRRAGLRDGVRVGVARAARRAPGRPRQLAGAARDRTAPATASTGSRFPSCRATPSASRCGTGAPTWSSRSTAPPSGAIRSGGFPRPRACSVPGPADVPREQRAPHAVHARRRRGRRGATCCARPSGCTAWSGDRTTRVEFHLSHGDWIRLLRGMASTWKS